MRVVFDFYAHVHADHVLFAAHCSQRTGCSASGPSLDKNIYVMIPSLLDPRQYSIIYNAFEVLQVLVLCKIVIQEPKRLLLITDQECKETI